MATQPLKFRPSLRTELTVGEILEWADEFLERNGRWPTRSDGHVDLTGNTWSALNASLQGGLRGLDAGSSLAKLLRDHRGRRHGLYRPPLTIDQIVAWADEHHDRTRNWPQLEQIAVEDVPGETWIADDDRRLSASGPTIRTGRMCLTGIECGRKLARNRSLRTSSSGTIGPSGVQLGKIGYDD